MIDSFRHKGLRLFFQSGDRSKLPAEMVDRIDYILGVLSAAGAIEEITAPSLRLHPMKGRMQGFWAMTVRANWRIVFRMNGDVVTDVDFVDYH